MTKDEFVEMVARMTTSAECSTSDSDTDTLDGLISQARELTGIDGPEVEEDDNETL